MEFVQKYWWILLLGVVIAIFIASRSKSAGGGSIQTIGGDQTQLAAIASAERQADEQNRVGLIGTFLAYIQGKDTLAASATAASEANAANIQIAQINATAAQAAAASQANLAAQGYNSSNYLANLAYQAQLAAIHQQGHNQTQTSLFNLLSQGLGTFLPLIFGGNNNDPANAGLSGILGGLGGWGTPPTFPVYGGNQGGWYTGW